MLVAVVAAAVVVAAVVAVLVATSGPAAPGAVTFAAGGQQSSTDPAQWCDLGVTECSEEPDALARLVVAPGAPLTVTVPDEVATTPWQVVFSFRDAGGAEQRGRTPVFAPGSPVTYTLTRPDPAGRLDSVEVQQYGALLGDGPEGVEFVTPATWVLAAGP